MTTPFWCLFIAVLLPYLLAFASAPFKTKQFGTLDNNEPRRQTAQLEGTGARVAAAQANAWEALTVFGLAVIVNHLNGADPGTSGTLAMTFIGARVVHAGAYIGDLAPLRSASFLVGLGCSIALFFV